jgi:hypothetical protein
MFTTIRRYQMKQPGQIDEVVRRVEKGLVPIVASQPGFEEIGDVSALVSEIRAAQAKL